MLCSLEIFALFMLTGIFSTLLLPETMNKSLEELSNEDQEGFIEGTSFFFHSIELGAHNLYFVHSLGPAGNHSELNDRPVV